MDFSNYRKELGVLDTGGSKKIPSINRQPPSAISPMPSNWPPNNGQVPKLSSAFGSFYNDSDENLSQFGQRSPGFRPGSSQNEDMGFPGDDRRPSVASATTVSSTGSKSSVGRGFHKKLQGFFGEDYPGESRQNSDSSLQQSAIAHQAEQGPSRPRNRNHSLSNVRQSGSRPTSPTSFSRPRTPTTSTEVTPWEFQDAQVRPFRFAAQSRQPA